MKTIKLKRLEINDFRAKSIAIDFKESTSISGENGVGKSTIMKAWDWLLSGYTDSYSPMNSALFDDSKELTPDTPTARVKAVVDIDGMEYTIERTATAKFTRKRGTTEYVKDTSDQYNFYIDNIEVKSNDFKQWIENNICQSDMITYVLDGSFLTSMIEEDKKGSRKVLEKIVGEIKEEDFKGDYSILKEDMKKYTIEQIEERTKREIVPIKDRMSKIPALIDTHSTTIAEYSSKDFDGIMKEIEKRKKEIEDIDNKILGNGDAIKPILGERNHLLDLINQKSAELNSERFKFNKANFDAEAELRKELDAAKAANNSSVSRYEFAKKLIEQKRVMAECVKENIATVEDAYNQTKKDLTEIKARVFTDDKCAYCGQELPEEMLNEAKEKFNARKKADIDSCVVRGKSIAKTKDELESELASVNNEIEDLVETLGDSPALIDVTEIEGRYNALKEENKGKRFEDTETYSRLVGEIEEFKRNMPEIPENDNASLTEAKKVLMGTIDNLNREYGIKYKIEELKGKIKELKDEERELGISLAVLEGKLAKCAEYKQEKADIISYRINGKLKESTIDMWSKQKDGTLVPDVVLKGKNGVRFSSLNFSDRIRTCIDIQRMFMEHFGISLPVWVDESSCFSSNNFPIIEGQVIYLFASESPMIEVSYDNKFNKNN